MVSRAKGFTGTLGQFFTPWSAPVTVRVFAPFDFQSTPSFPDFRGDSYKLRGIVREKAARGSKVRISLARGYKGGRFHSIGKAKIRRGGKITKRFTIRNPGKYRLKYRFKGNSQGAARRLRAEVHHPAPLHLGARARRRGLRPPASGGRSGRAT